MGYHSFAHVCLCVCVSYKILRDVRCCFMYRDAGDVSGLLRVESGLRIGARMHSPAASPHHHRSPSTSGIAKSGSIN